MSFHSKLFLDCVTRFSHFLDKFSDTVKNRTRDVRARGWVQPISTLTYLPRAVFARFNEFLNYDQSLLIGVLTDIINSRLYLDD